MQKPSEELKLLHVNHQISGGGAVHLPARLFMHSGVGGGGQGGREGWDWWGQGNDGQVTHESPAHNSQLVTLKLRPPPTLPWQEFERGYGQEEGG